MKYLELCLLDESNMQPITEEQSQNYLGHVQKIPTVKQFMRRSLSGSLVFSRPLCFLHVS